MCQYYKKGNISLGLGPCTFYPNLGEYRDGVKPCSFVNTKHDVHVLDGLTAGALGEVVDHADDDGPGC